MAINFAELTEIYRHTRFHNGEREGTVMVASEALLVILRQLDTDEAAQESGIGLMVDPRTLAVGQETLINIRPPRLSLGILAHDFDQLLRAPAARLEEPKAYFVIVGALSRDMAAAPPRLKAYRVVVDLLLLFAEAASYLDRTKQELVFIHEGKFAVPVEYDASVLDRLPLAQAKRLRDQFSDEIHKDQKLEILTEAIVRTSQGQPGNLRLVYLLDNLAALADAVRDGYRLFASNFSYAKIRSELETAKLEYVGKIHKTVVDIQGQLLGIPVATVIVASQMKVAKSCSMDLWTDVAVLAGAWIFLILLLVAIANQWFTLASIKEEIGRQEGKLVRDYAAISQQFMDVFSSLGQRIWWHRFGLVVIGIIATAGAIFATVAFAQVVQTNVIDCLVGKSALAFR